LRLNAQFRFNKCPNIIPIYLGIKAEMEWLPRCRCFPYRKILILWQISLYFGKDARTSAKP
jgi:hypothetical protein